MDLSIVIPVFNESENIERQYRAIRDALEPEFAEFEILFVDDGSQDGTEEILKKLVECDSRIRGLKLRRNFGQTAALRAGFDQARGDILVTMDGDLQNDARDIPVLLKKIDEGCDLVTGWRYDRQDRLLSRRLPSVIANWIVAKVTRVPIHDTGCALKAYRAELVRRIPLYGELHRFIPAMSTMVGARFAEVVVRHHARRYGASKYGLSRVWRVVLDVIVIKMLISFSTRPLHWFGTWSVPFFALAGVMGVSSIRSALSANSPPNTVMPALTLLTTYLATHLLLAGVFGDLVVRCDPTRRLEPLVRHVEIE